MPLISDLTRREQRTVARLVKDKDVAVDRITGLFESIKEDFYKENPNATGIDWKPGTATVNGSAPPPGNPSPYSPKM